MGSLNELQQLRQKSYGPVLQFVVKLRDWVQLDCEVTYKTGQTTYLF